MRHQTTCSTCCSDVCLMKSFTIQLQYRQPTRSLLSDRASSDHSAPDYSDDFAATPSPAAQELPHHRQKWQYVKITQPMASQRPAITVTGDHYVAWRCVTCSASCTPARFIFSRVTLLSSLRALLCSL
ncbi:unnamed protein product [Polarella glacialis]|uniref:Uncharacterized protein n=1 Tax=Polarella glacialis TaxID=89957 RepID=A0A813IB09_POLGL|nr:unnamed protein product [Polarella glacialis]